jgi:TonB family protein
MNAKDHNEQEIFQTGTTISDPVSWFSSILRQLRARREEQNSPAPPLTANPDPEGLKVMLPQRSTIASLVWTVRDVLSSRNQKIETTATPVAVEELWSTDNSGYSGLVSVGAHLLILMAIVLIPAAAALNKAATPTSIIMLSDPPLVLNLPKIDGRSGGGGGGGMKAPTPPSKGELPKGSDKQLLPPAVEIKNFAPDLVVEPTVIAPQLSNLAPVTFVFGDPNGVAGPPSAGPGTGGGIGTGTGTGIGSGKGAGVGPGEGGGIGGGIFSVGGGVSAPQLTYQLQPEYSEDGRKGRIQGTVELLIVVNPDGTVKFDRVQKSLGYGLDQKAIEAVRKWKFIAGKRDGVPVATYVSVLVNFTLR